MESIRRLSVENPFGYKHLLLGFDSKEMWSNFKHDWSLTRIEQNLFKHDIKKPLSVDSLVWPSIFDLKPKLPKPAWTGPVQGLWDDLNRLKQTVLKIHSRIRNLWFVAITAVMEPDTDNLENLWTGRLSGINPEYIQKEWTFLGYDVADVWLESSLTNGALSRIFRENQEYSSYLLDLNQYHLFNSWNSAYKFSHFAEKHRPDHRPQCVFSLWRIP